MSLVLATNAEGDVASVMEANPRGRQCSWSMENDARRPATKQLVESLHTKIQMLEAELAQLKGRPEVGGGDRDASVPLEHTTMFPSDQGAVVTAERKTETSGVYIEVTAMYRYIFDIDAGIPVYDQQRDVYLSLVCEWNRHLPQLPYFTRLEHDTILSRCFKYGVAWLHCMITEMFLHNMLYALAPESSNSTVDDQLRLQHYTPMLHCALIAYAAAFSDNAEIRSPSFRGRFAQHAKQWLDYEFERPVAALPRALALLAEYHCAVGEQSAGFMYMGMSIRAARSLVPRDDESLANEVAVVLPTALELKHQYDLPVPYPGVALPSTSTEFDSQPWSDGLAGYPPRLITKTFLNSCKLMVIASSIIELLYDSDQGDYNERAVIDLHLRLDTWFNELPRELLVWARSTSPIPHPLYDRPKLSAEDSERPSISSDDSGHGTTGGPIHDLSTKMVERATHKIVQLLQLFDEQHGMKFFPRNMVHVIYECGIVLLKEAAHTPPGATKKRVAAVNACHMCLHALRGASKTWLWAEHLAGKLEEDMKVARANTASQPLPAEYFVPDTERSQTGDSLHPFFHVRETVDIQNSTRSDSVNQPPRQQSNSPKTILSTSSLGLDLSALHQQTLADPATIEDLEEMVGHTHKDTGANLSDELPFLETPASSTALYPLPQHSPQGGNVEIWGHYMF
ncbi:Fungal specific transcription factor domain [Rhizoctonia solani]|uniref:Fungal specific transcription factor domain n=1 Tax=Rhizoctonia solani TaxID=456999 RepID=A0A8H8NV93_9AGAM|nr:Fungal specific transcription factor domain [Rhizoctonia solani]QRW20701.1 Fungal specific transcription factor domain [Rhizoctonia solani]